MITWADVVNRAPELGRDPALTVLTTVPTGGSATPATTVVADVILQLKDGTWKDDATRNLAMCYLVAHISTLIVRGGFGPSGAVIGESVGSVSRQYGNNSPMGSHPYWDTTPYGRLYRQLLRQNSARYALVT